MVADSYRVYSHPHAGYPRLEADNETLPIKNKGFNSSCIDSDRGKPGQIRSSV